MTTNKNILSGDFYLLPVVAENGIYTPINQTYHEAIDLHFLQYLERNHLKTDASVSISGIIYSGSVYVSKDPDDCSFAIIDHRMQPAGEEERMPTLREDVEIYLARLRQRISNSEGIIPEQTAFIPSQFIRPELISSDGTSKDIKLEHLQDIRRALISGGPGAGKTTLLRHLTLMFLQEIAESEDRNSIKRLPIYITLRNWSTPKGILNTLQNTITADGGEWIASNINELANQGGLILLFDGLDETTELIRNQFTQWISSFGKAFPRTQIFLTTRPHTCENLPRDYTEIKIKPFDTLRVRDFASRRLFEDKSWRRFVSCYRESGDMQYILGNPLMLTIATYLYRRSSIIPQNTAQLLTDFITAVTETWDSSRGIKRIADQQYSPNRIRNSLSRIAFECIENGLNEFTEDQARSWLDLGDGTKSIHHYLLQLRDVCGLLVQERPGEWCFSHRFFMDCFAATFLIDGAEGVEPLYRKHANSLSWRTLWGHAAGLTSDPASLYRIYTTPSATEPIFVIRRIISVLLESLVIGSKTVSESVDHLAQQLEKQFSALDIHIKADPPIIHKSKSITNIWRISFRDNEDGEHLAKEYAELITSINALRWTPYSTVVISRLQRSQIRSISRLSELWTFDGTIKIEPQGKTIIATLEREAPELFD